MHHEVSPFPISVTECQPSGTQTQRSSLHTRGSSVTNKPYASPSSGHDMSTQRRIMLHAVTRSLRKPNPIPARSRPILTKMPPGGQAIFPTSATQVPPFSTLGHAISTYIPFLLKHRVAIANVKVPVARQNEPAMRHCFLALCASSMWPCNAGGARPRANPREAPRQTPYKHVCAALQAFEPGQREHQVSMICTAGSFDLGKSRGNQPAQETNSRHRRPRQKRSPLAL